MRTETKSISGGTKWYKKSEAAQKKSRQHAHKQATQSQKGISNREYAGDERFVTLCQNAGCEATKRQASKFRAGRGSAHNFTKAN